MTTHGSEPACEACGLTEPESTLDQHARALPGSRARLQAPMWMRLCAGCIEASMRFGGAPVAEADQCQWGKLREKIARRRQVTGGVTTATSQSRCACPTAARGIPETGTRSIPR